VWSGSANTLVFDLNTDTWIDVTVANAGTVGADEVRGGPWSTSGIDGPAVTVRARGVERSALVEVTSGASGQPP
jgi:hypothetical protein